MRVTNERRDRWTDVRPDEVLERRELDRGEVTRREERHKKISYLHDIRILIKISELDPRKHGIRVQLIVWVRPKHVVPTGTVPRQ